MFTFLDCHCRRTNVISLRGCPSGASSKLGACLSCCVTSDNNVSLVHTIRNHVCCQHVTYMSKKAYIGQCALETLLWQSSNMLSPRAVALKFQAKWEYSSLTGLCCTKRALSRLWLIHFDSNEIGLHSIHRKMYTVIPEFFIGSCFYWESSNK